MKKLFILLILFSCNTAKQLERSVAKVEKYKKILGVKPCEYPQTVNWGSTGTYLLIIPDYRQPYIIGNDLLTDTLIKTYRAIADTSFKGYGTTLLGTIGRGDSKITLAPYTEISPLSIINTK